MDPLFQALAYVAGAALNPVTLLLMVLVGALSGSVGASLAAALGLAIFMGFAEAYAPQGVVRSGPTFFDVWGFLAFWVAASIDGAVAVWFGRWLRGIAPKKSAAPNPPGT